MDWLGVSPDRAREMHRSQGKATLIVVMVGLGLTAVGLTPFILGWHQVLFWGVMLGVPALLTCAWLGRGQLGRDKPPRYSVRLSHEGVEGRWAGQKASVIPWSDVRRVVDQPSAGFVVVGRGGRSIVFTPDLPDLADLRARVAKGKAAAPPPVVETKIGVDLPRVPVQAGTEKAILLIDRVRGPLGWAAIGSLLFIPLGLVTNPLLAGVGGGLCALLGGLWWALVLGLRNGLLGVSVVTTAFVVQTTYRGWRAKLMAGANAFIGLTMAMMGGLVTLACLLGAVFPA